LRVRLASPIRHGHPLATAGSNVDTLPKSRHSHFCLVNCEGVDRDLPSGLLVFVTFRIHRVVTAHGEHAAWHRHHLPGLPPRGRSPLCFLFSSSRWLLCSPPGLGGFTFWLGFLVALWFTLLLLCVRFASGLRYLSPGFVGLTPLFIALPPHDFANLRDL